MFIYVLSCTSFWLWGFILQGCVGCTIWPYSCSLLSPLVEYLCVLKPRLQVTSIMHYCTFSHNVLVYVKILCCCGNNCFLRFCFLVFVYFEFLFCYLLVTVIHSEIKTYNVSMKQQTLNSNQCRTILLCSAFSFHMILGYEILKICIPVNDIFLILACFNQA